MSEAQLIHEGWRQWLWNEMWARPIVNLAEKLGQPVSKPAKKRQRRKRKLEKARD